MTDEKIVQFISKIGEKTESNAISWEKTAAVNEFQATLANFVIRIREYYGENESDPSYAIKIIDNNGNSLETLTDADLFQIARRNPNAFTSAFNRQAGNEVMPNIFKNAKRHALGVEQAIDDILSQLE